MMTHVMNSVSKDDIQKKIVDIIAEKLGIEPEKVVATTSVQALGIDSLDLIEIVLEIEDTFGCCIDDAKIEQLEAVAEIVDYVYGICKK